MMGGGDLAVESEVGLGSTFSFTAQFDLPRGATGTRRLADEFRDLPVLVADDNASARTVLTNMLRSLSCQVTAVDSGEAAVNEVMRAKREGQPYRLAVLDWKMPGLDGAAAAARITSDSPLPIILVTAYEREYADRQAEVKGIDAVLHKPVSPSMLHDAVLSVLQPAPRRIKTGEQPNPVRFTGNRRVLLVEDNEINREVARELLSAAGLRVTEAHNGYEAMEKLSSETFDAVLMDVQMPELDGVETVKAIRAASGRFGNLPVIAMTAHAMLGDRERFLDAGMSDYIAKPIEEKELIAVLKKWIGGTEPITAKQKLPVPPPVDKTEMLPGLLIGDGVRRTNGNMQLYKRLLAEFRREMDEVLPHLRSLIGARRVAEIAAALESRLRKGEAITADELAEAVAEVRMSIDAFLSADAPPVVETKPGASNPQILPIAKRLAEHLRKNNLAAMSCFEELKAVAGSRFGEPMVKLEQSLDRLDFDAARVHLESIETQLEEAAP
jgi:CheY-like chemotaxis protein